MWSPRSVLIVIGIPLAAYLIGGYVAAGIAIVLIVLVNKR